MRAHLLGALSLLMALPAWAASDQADTTPNSMLAVTTDQSAPLDKKREDSPARSTTPPQRYDQREHAAEFTGHGEPGRGEGTVPSTPVNTSGY